MKAEKAEIARRIDEVLRIIVDGAEMHDIVQFSSEKGWNVGERQLRNYMARANDLLTERMERDRDKLLARHISQRRNLYARAINSGQFGVALATIKDEAELEGLYPPKKVAPTTPDGKQSVYPSLETLVAAIMAEEQGEDVESSNAGGRAGDAAAPEGSQELPR